MTDSSFYQPDVPWPQNVRALVTTRFGGVSEGGKESFNLATHVGDDLQAVMENRRRLRCELESQNPIAQAGSAIQIKWLQQVHACQVVDLSTIQLLDGPVDNLIVEQAADAAVTTSANEVCAVLTADCMPVLMATSDGQSVAAAHAGWRGLAAGILLDTLFSLTNPGSLAKLRPITANTSEQSRQFDKLISDVSRAIVYLGPTIGWDNYEVGAEVKTQVLALTQQIVKKLCLIIGSQSAPTQSQLIQSYLAGADACFHKTSTPGKYQFDLYALAKTQLMLAGVLQVYGGNYCTFEDDRWYSHRQNPQSGRFASVIWRVN